VGGVRIGREHGAIKQHHIMAEPSQEQRGGRTRGACANDNDVMTVFVDGHECVTPGPRW
jgi:hypothetical protein